MRRNRKKLTEVTKEQREVSEQIVYEGADELAAEMNLRLLCGATNNATTILWVESISIADISYPSRNRKRKIMAIIYKLLKRKKE